MDYRPECLLMPELDPEVYQALLEDIRVNGQHADIVLHPDGMVLDGRHRLRACLELGIEPRFTTWKGEPGTELDWVLGENLYRRHLTQGQRAMLTLAVREEEAEKAKQRRVSNLPTLAQPQTVAELQGDMRQSGAYGRVEEILARRFGVGHQAVHHVYWLHQQGFTDLLEAIEHGAPYTVAYQEGKARSDPPSEEFIIEQWAGLSDPRRRGYAWAYAHDTALGYDCPPEEILKMWAEDAAGFRPSSPPHPVVAAIEEQAEQRAREILAERTARSRANKDSRTAAEREIDEEHLPQDTPPPNPVRQIGLAGSLETVARKIRLQADVGPFPEHEARRIAVAVEAIRQSLAVHDQAQPQGLGGLAQQFNQSSHEKGHGTSDE